MDSLFIDKTREMLRKRIAPFYHYPLSTLLLKKSVYTNVTEWEIDFLVNHRKDLITTLSRQNFWSDRTPTSEIADFTLDNVTSYLYSRNQFLDIDPVRKSKLGSYYVDLYTSIQNILTHLSERAAIKKALENYLDWHISRLGDFVTALYPETHRQNNIGQHLPEVVCAEYSSQLQLYLLGIEVEKLRDPVFDLGCGHNGTLVHYLKRKGIKAHGADRHAPPGSDFTSHDWFNINIQPCSWGTVLSHMAFSLHFIHHHLRKDGHPDKYARYYMRILKSLKIGGCFIYTPGLPFIEEHLPASTYFVERKMISSSVSDNSWLQSFYKQTCGVDLNYTTCITRIK